MANGRKEAEHMPDQEKIRLMTRLAILEKENGKELRRIQETYRSDYIGIPMLKNGLRITAVFLLILGIWLVCNMDPVLGIAAEGQLSLLLVGIGAAYAIVLLVTLIVTFLCASLRYYRGKELEREYQELLDELRKKMERTGEKQQRENMERA